MYVGLDDVDTGSQGCTTHLTFRVLRSIINQIPQAVVSDYPVLIRLNPTIPFKTRGNAALSFTVKLREREAQSLREIVLKEVSSYTAGVRGAGAEPGVALLYGEVPEALERLYVKALSDYVHKDYVLGVIKTLEGSLEVPLGYSRGLIGALAAIGASKYLRKCTYELLSYRGGEKYSVERCVDEESVKVMDERFRSDTFLNYDYASGELLITPSGPNPVLLGLRGEDPESLVRAFSMLRICENYEGWVIYKTNQAVNAHHVERCLECFKPYQTGCVRARVVDKPVILPGGDVLVKLGDRNAETRLWAAFFRETGLNKVARRLMTGDLIAVCGGGRYWEGRGVVVHSDLLEVLELTSETYVNPTCPVCGHRMKSSGRGKGWKCLKCGFKSTNLSKGVVKLIRDLERRTYRPRDIAVKHLVMPESRVGRVSDCSKPLINKWIYFNSSPLPSQAPRERLPPTQASP